MANQTIFDLPEASTVVGTDYVPVYKTASGLTRKVKVSNLLAGILGTLPLLAGANTWSGQNTFDAKTFLNRETVIAPTNTGDVGLLINMPSGALERPIRVRLDGVERFNINISSTVSLFNMSAFDNGTGSGPSVSISNNNNASTPAPGSMRLDESDGGQNYTYYDASGIMRRLATAPTSATQASGDVIGAQTSALSAKIVEGEFTDIEAALQLICDTPLYRFAYREIWQGEQFVGLITDYSPIFGLDRDEDHPNGKILNEVNAHGYALAAIKALSAKVDELRALILPLLP